MKAIATKQPTHESAKQNRSGEKGRSRSISPLSTGMPLLQRQCACGGGCPRCKEELGIQTKLKISEPGDKYEQEADRIADEVMRMPEPSVQRQVEPEEEEEEMVQRKVSPLDSKPESSEIPPIVREVINSPGQPLDAATRTFMESRFGHDFNQVRVHTDGKAAESAQSIYASAYTVGRNIVFGKDRYLPLTQEGRQLLAHELTHVLQQGMANSSIFSIQRVPATTPPPHSRPYTLGIAHRHSPSGRWADVQADARRRCSSGLAPMTRALRSRRLPTLPSARSPIECACATMPPQAVLLGAFLGRMATLPLARAHLWHFVYGGGVDYVEDVHDFISRDAGVRSKIERRLRGSRRGHFKVHQGDYRVEDFQFAFGAIDRLDYDYDRAAGIVHVWFADYYEFHPVYPGLYGRMRGDSPRPTNCVHAAAVELKAGGGAADYWMYGYATLPASLFSIPTRSRRRRHP